MIEDRWVKLGLMEERRSDEEVCSYLSCFIRLPSGSRLTPESLFLPMFSYL